MALYQNLNTLHQYLLVAFKILGLPISLKAGELSLIFKKSKSDLANTIDREKLQTTTTSTSPTN
jgi:hypothetical protein